MANGIPTDPPTSRTIDFGALVRRALGDEYHKHEKVYQVGKGRTFESSDYGTQGIYGAARSVILSGTAVGGDSSSITLGTEANGGGNDYVAHQISAADFALTTQTSTIVAYNESTRSARVIPSWASNFVLHTGTAQGAGGNYLTLGTGAPSTVTGTLSLTSGAGSTQSRDILSYDDSSKRAVVSRWDAPYLSIGSDDDGAQATFYLDFPDLGSGVVDTTPTFGTVSPTFTRATSATTVDSTGTIISVSSGVPRSYYDPTTLAYLGYLAEGARTNLCLQSEVLSSATEWNSIGGSVTDDATTAPDGAATADKVIEDTSTGGHFIQSDSNYTISAGSAVVASAFVKADERTIVQLDVRTGANTPGYTCTFDLSAGTAGTPSAIGSPTGSATATIKAYPNGWYRIALAISQLDAGSTAALCRWRLCDGTGVNSYTGVAGNGAYFWGTQFEAAAFASSYIPTTTAAVARNADVLTYPTTGWLNASAGTMFTEAAFGGMATSQRIAQLGDGTGNERIGFLFASATVIQAAIIDGGVSQMGLSIQSNPVADTLYSYALAYSLNDGAGVANGGTVLTDASVTIPTVDTLGVGCTEAGAAQLFGPIRRVAYFPLRLLNATLVTLTDSGLTFDPSTFPVALPGATTVYKVEKVGPGVNTTYSISAT